MTCTKPATFKSFVCGIVQSFFFPFPQGGLPITALTELSIYQCKILTATPKRMHNFTSLRFLQIAGCPSIGSNPDDGLPTNIRTLWIDYQKMWKPLFEWELHRFASIRELSLYGKRSEVVSFGPEDTGMPLPASLTSLRMSRFSVLESLSSIESLTSLSIFRLIILQISNVLQRMACLLHFCSSISRNAR